MASLNDFLPQLGTQDTKKKLQLGVDIVRYLEDPLNQCVELDDLGPFVDGLVAWLNSSNFKVSLNGLEILVRFVDRLQDEFRPYVSTVLPATVDRLGDTKDQVREVSQLLILKLMNLVANPQYIFDKLSHAFSHKNGRVRQEIMVTLQTSLHQNGAQSLSLSKLVPFIVKLLSDPTAPVRDEAANTLVEIYRHVGEKVRADLAKKQTIPMAKLQSLLAKFDEVRDSGQMLPAAVALPCGGSSSTTSSQDDGSRGDEVDRAVMLGKTPASKRANSAPPVRRNVFAAPSKLPPAASTAAALQRKGSFRSVTSATPTGQGCSLDEETFIRSFEEVPKVQMFSVRDLEDQLQKCREILSDISKEWDTRVEALKKIRALIVAGAANYDELYPILRLLEGAFQVSVKDLRSQVTREACITIAYMCQQLGHKMDHFCESLLPCLINLIQNSAKVVATAGIVAIRFVIQHTHASRLIPIITGQMTSKSKDIRRAACEFLDQLLHTWPTHSLERHIAILQDAIKKGLSDADPEARASSRKAFWGFHDHFKEQADSLLNSLESSKQRMLQGEVCLSSSSSNNSLQNSAGRGSRSKASSAASSTENLSRIPTYGLRSTGRSGIPVSAGSRNGPNISLSNGPSSTMRSVSAIDLNAVQRARARQAYAAAARLKVGSGASLPRPAHKPREINAPSMCTPMERSGRSATRSTSGVSLSQPSSRSVSPSSRTSYATYATQSPDGGCRTRRKSGSMVARSTGASRETSPNRRHYGGYERRISGGLTRSIRPLLGANTERFFGSASAGSPSHYTNKSPQVMAERILLQSREAEAAMADALRVASRRKYESYNNESDDSETSSVCSERSYGSLNRGISVSGYLVVAYGRPLTIRRHFRCMEVADIIHNLASQHWSDRKEGLIGLQYLLQRNRLLTQVELKRVTEIFTKMFMDPHTKVFSFFLDTLNELVITHKVELHDWLYILATRLLNKQGTPDLLGSVLNKIQRSLEVVRESFPYDEQFYIIVRFLIDQTQTPNVKVKLAALSYLQVVAQLLEPFDFKSSLETQAAFTKIITWTTDQKSAELRKASQATLFTFFSLNTPEFTKLLNQLPRNLSDGAFKMLQNMLKNPPSPMAPRSQATNFVARTRPMRLSMSVDVNDTENMNPEDVYVSLRETSAEIQNYSFDGIDRSFSKERCELDRDTTSQDSGISQMSVPDGRMDVLEEKYESSSEDCSPVRHRDYSVAQHQQRGTPQNGYGCHSISDSLSGSDITLLAEELYETLGNMEDVLATAMDVRKSVDDRDRAITSIAALARKADASVWDQNFRSVLRALLDALEEPNNLLRAKALMVLAEVVDHQSGHFEGFTELTILKVLGATKDPVVDVSRTAEFCAATLGCVLSTKLSVRVINPVILTGQFPVNLAAVKMLTKVIEHRPHEEIIEIVPDVMPGLLKAYHNEESTVRKSAVFCMVALHSAVGDAITPYFSELNGSKMKLLNVYIKRAQSQQALSSQGSSSPGSPKITPLPGNRGAISNCNNTKVNE